MSVAGFDFAHYLTNVTDIMKDVYFYDGSGFHPDAFGHYYGTDPVTLVGNKPEGFYWDLFGGGGNLSVLQTTPSLNPNGNSDDWESGKRSLAAGLRQEARLLDAGFYTSTEAPEEGLIGTVDFMHTGGIGDAGNSEWGVNAFLFTVVYSRYQCLFSFSSIIPVDALQTIPAESNFFYTAWCSAEFHVSGGHINLGCFSTTVPPIFMPVAAASANITNTPFFILFVLMRSMYDALEATPMMRKYMRAGWRCRPLPASWEGAYVASGRPLAAYIARSLAQLESGTTRAEMFVSSSVWMYPDVDDDYTDTSHCIGIVITSGLTEDTDYRIQMQSEAYDLDPHAPKALYVRLGSGGSSRTELTRFTTELDYTVTLVFDFVSAPVMLFEVAYV